VLCVYIFFSINTNTHTYTQKGERNFKMEKKIRKILHAVESSERKENNKRQVGKNNFSVSPAPHTQTYTHRIFSPPLTLTSNYSHFHSTDWLSHNGLSLYTHSFYFIHIFVCEL
jgi:hypothetical protein